MVDELIPIKRTYVKWRDKTWHFFGGYDYHRLSSHPDVLAAIRNALASPPINSGGSRATTGNHPLHEALDATLAAFFQSEAAVTLPDGYLANIAVLQAIHADYDPCFIDENAHPCLRDALILHQKTIIPFRHADADDLATKIANHTAKDTRPLILTEGIGHLYGGIPPLKDYAALAEKTHATIIVDDAHAAGTLGKTGRGSVEETGADPRFFIQTGTLSKAFGVYGGYVLGSKSLIQRIRRESNAFVGTSAFPMPFCQAAIIALDLIHREPERVTRLQQRARQLKGKLNRAGLNLPVTPVPTIAVIPESNANEEKLRHLLLKNRIYPSHIHYPGAPAAGYYRFALSSAHSDEQIDLLTQTLVNALTQDKQ